MTRMKNPVHPGPFIRMEILEPLGLTVGQAAIALGVKRQTLSNLLNAHAKLSEEMALRMDKAFNWPAETLLAMQHAYDLARLRDREAEIHVSRFEARGTAQAAAVRSRSKTSAVATVLPQGLDPAR